MEKDPITKAAGFKMDNLRAFPFSRLPRNFQVEVLEKTFMDENIELFNVASGFRGFFAKNGVFGRHVLSISLSQVVLKDGEKNYLRISVKINCYDRDFYFPKDRVLFQHICSCTAIGLDYSNEQRLDKLIEAKVDMKIGDWFPNLRFVRNLDICGWGHPFVEGLLESFHFQITNISCFRSAEIQLSGSSHWEYLLANQLSNCAKVIIANRLLTDEIPGMEIERDSDKCKDISDAFKKQGLSWLISRNSVIQYYRRKITDDKEMMVMAVANYD